MHSESKPGPKKPHLELIPLKPGVSATRPTHLEVLLRVRIPELEARPQRPLMNLALVLDRSGSMRGQKLGYAKEAAIYAVHNLLPEDRVAVVAYDDEVQVLVPSTPAAERTAIAARIQSLRPGGRHRAARGLAGGRDPGGALPGGRADKPGDPALRRPG